MTIISNNNATYINNGTTYNCIYFKGDKLLPILDESFNISIIYSTTSGFHVLGMPDGKYYLWFDVLTITQHNIM
jgi:hypothetical protein